MANFFDMFKRKKKKKIQKTLPVIVVADSSASMAGERMLCVNNTINMLTERFARFNQNEANEFSIKIAVLSFSSDAQWVTRGLEYPDCVKLSSIPCGGESNLGCALTELDSKLSRKAFFSESIPYASPLICFISDSRPADNYEAQLRKLKENEWYKASKKLAVAIGEDADSEALCNVDGDFNSVIPLSSAAFLEQTFADICTSLFNSLGGTDSMVQNANPSVSIGSDDFDSDNVCSTGMAIQNDELDSDYACRSTCMTDNPSIDFDDDDAARTMAPSFAPPDGKSHCKSCGNIIMEGFKVCPYCGTPIQNNPSSEIGVSQVQFSAVVPKRFVKGEYAMIDISVYEEEYRHIVERMIANADGEVREVIASPQEVADNTMIRIELTSPDIDVSDCEETQKWQRKYLTFSFPVEIPSDYAKNQILFIAKVYFNGIIATKLKFVANCTLPQEQKPQISREDVLTAFISYASQDRSRVATIIQGMKKARPDMDIFFDVESLRSGEYWEAALRREIEKRDILFLCWSNNAKNSEWVQKEWQYALTNKGLDSIEPIPLVSPAECPPPEELKSKHFNDRTLLYR